MHFDEIGAVDEEAPGFGDGAELLEGLDREAAEDVLDDLERKDGHF